MFMMNIPMDIKCYDQYTMFASYDINTLNLNLIQVKCKLLLPTALSKKTKCFSSCGDRSALHSVQL